MQDTVIYIFVDFTILIFFSFTPSSLRSIPKFGRKICRVVCRLSSGTITGIWRRKNYGIWLMVKFWYLISLSWALFKKSFEIITIQRILFEAVFFSIKIDLFSRNLQKRELPKYLFSEETNANNYDPKGWGEGGSPVELKPEEKQIAQDLFPINQFNIYVSDRISVNRSLPDMRRTVCREKKYPGLKFQIYFLLI